MGDALDHRDEIGGIGILRRRLPRRTVTHDAAALLSSDDGERGCSRMRAALGAARHMHGNAVARKRHMARKLRSECARRDQAMRAERRSRAGGDAAARIGGLGDETKAVCRLLCRPGPNCAERPKEKSSARRRPCPKSAVGLGDPGKLYESAGLRVTKGKTESEREVSAAEGMAAHGIRARGFPVHSARRLSPYDRLRQIGRASLGSARGNGLQ